MSKYKVELYHIKNTGMPNVIVDVSGNGITNSIAAAKAALSLGDAGEYGVETVWQTMGNRKHFDEVLNKKD